MKRLCIPLGIKTSINVIHRQVYETKEISSLVNICISIVRSCTVFFSVIVVRPHTGASMI